MHVKNVIACVVFILGLGVGSGEAQIDCSNVAPSAGQVPQELVDHCWVGPGPSNAPDFPSDLAFGPETQSAMLVNHALNAPEVLNAIAAFDVASFPGACEFAGPFFDILHCGNSANEFFYVDTATGVRTDIGLFIPPPPGAETISGLAWDNTTNRMFMVTTDVVTSSLLEVFSDGSTTYIGAIAGSGGMIALAADPSGSLFGYDLVTDDLWSIDKNTGAGTSIGPIGFDANFGQGMDFDDSDGTCYLFAFNGVTFLPELRTCDTSTGATTLVGVLGATTPGALAQIPGAGIAAAAFSPSMFAIDEGTDEFFGIDLATGQTNLIGPVGFNMSLSGIAWDSWGKKMYVSDLQSTSGEIGLGTIDLSTGAATYIGWHVNSSNIQGLAFDSINNVLYGADVECPGLATVDRNTGESTCIGPWVANSGIQGMAYDNNSDTLYGIDSTYVFTLNRATGEATILGPHGISILFPIGLSYAADYAVLLAGGGGDPTLYVIDPGTGAGSPAFPHGLASLGGLASTAAPGEPCGIFCDGFESGDTLAWN